MAHPETESFLAEVRGRFGVLPNFFRLASSQPEITRNLWAFAQFAYLDNPLPSLFKERLFVYLSRFCEVRYCIARHVGFLAGLGRPSGDAQCPPQTVEEIVHLLRRPLARGALLDSKIALCAAEAAPLAQMPASNSPLEKALFACSTHVFLQTADAPRCLESLARLLGETCREQLTLFLTFVRAAHYWTLTHPELRFEADIQALLAAHEMLAECVLQDPEAGNFREVRQQPFPDVAVLFEDAANRRRAEEALREREADLARVQKIGRVGGIDIEVAGDLRSRRSPEYLRLHGLPPDTGDETHA